MSTSGPRARAAKRLLTRLLTRSLRFCIRSLPLARELSNASPLRANFGLVSRHSFENRSLITPRSTQAIVDYSAIIRFSPFFRVYLYTFVWNPNFLNLTKEDKKVSRREIGCSAEILRVNYCETYPREASFDSSYCFGKCEKSRVLTEITVKLITQFYLVCRIVLGVSKGNPGPFNSSSLSTRKVFCTSKFECTTKEKRVRS